MPSYREPRRKDWLKSLIHIALYVAILGVSTFYLLVSYWYLGGVGSCWFDDSHLLARQSYGVPLPNMQL